MPPAQRSSREPVVVSVGGSVFLAGDHDARFVSALARLLRRLGRSFPLVVTVGGGRTARDYIRVGRDLGLTEVELDELGIEVTRLHARLLAACIGPPTPAQPPVTVAAAVHEVHRVSPVVLGGTEPGHSTDGVAALVAVRLRAARLVNATNVTALHDVDPQKNSSARAIPRISWSDFRHLVHRETSGAAGDQFLFDRLGADALARAQIPLRIVDGRNLSNLEKAILGRPFQGTSVG
ncbi:MAG: UMP kinase [Thermoplasmata archaeon]